MIGAVRRYTIPTSGKYKNKWPVTVYHKWQTAEKVQVHVSGSGGMFKDCDLRKVGILTTRIEDMDTSSLNYWLSKFIMAEAKKSGERHSPMTVWLRKRNPTLP